MMSLRRVPSDNEIEALAARFRAIWAPGEVIRPWLRQHAEMLLALVREGWSWAAIARALTRAGITYRTGRAWTADGLQSEAYRARKPLRGYVRKSTQPTETDLARGSEGVPPAPAAGAILPTAAPAEPRFKPVSFRPIEPPRPLTDAEREIIERNRRMTFGPAGGKE